MRLGLISSACVLATIATAHADPCVTPPKDDQLRALSVVRAPADPSEAHDDLGFAEAKGTEFPALSEDGKRLVQLYHDTEDFTAVPSSTLVIYSTANAHVIKSFSAGGRPSDPGVAATIKKANAALASSRWRPLATFTQCHPTQDTLTVDGITYTYDQTKNTLAQTRGKRTLKLKEVFPGSGWRDSGSCGNTIGLAGGFGDAKAGLVVLVPNSSFGGDSCMGAPESSRVLPLRVR
jgi:hypothetical protein